MEYTREDILYKCKNALKEIGTFYKQDFINYRGKTSDTNEMYSEIVAEFVCEHLKEFDNEIPKITREKSYKTKGHDGEHVENSIREEEIIAMDMFRQSEGGQVYEYIGKIIDYQTPLKNKRDDVAGKIDLLSYDGRTLRILELKKPDSNETMLRCVLEGFTYLKTVNQKKLLEDFKLPENTEIRACPFVFKDKEQYNEMKEERVWLKELMRLIESKPYYIVKEENGYKTEE